MTKHIEFKGAKGTYTITLKRSKRSKHVRLSVRPSGHVLLSRPWWVREKEALAFLERHKDWLEEIHRKHLSSLPPDLRANDREHYKKNKERARALLKKKVEYWNRFYGFRFTAIRVADQKSRWGSCSSKGTLSFSYKVLFLPEELQDYLVVHELCHLKEMNHSADFWELVSRTIPRFKERRRDLRKGGIRTEYS